ncbi:MAG TPA: hypothetical protein VG247_20885 [Pseudonocardiaceae bacterium]|jgi:hypothetical protein|nr:hypothetical protein [Pseudonocardiaceae bacterium]
MAGLVVLFLIVWFVVLIVKNRGNAGKSRPRGREHSGSNGRQYGPTSDAGASQGDDSYYSSWYYHDGHDTSSGHDTSHHDSGGYYDGGHHH